jgi:magnesium chelatase family protein
MFFNVALLSKYRATPPTPISLSARACDRILKVSRTVTDLQSRDDITTEHVSEAIPASHLIRTLWV